MSARRILECHQVGDGIWLARTRRDARFRISVRHMPDGVVYDVRRSVIGGLSYLGSATTLERARELAEENYRALRTSDRIEPKSRRHVA